MTDQPASTAPLAAGLPLVKGRCPACGTSGLFLGDGGYVTCSLIDCPRPDLVNELIGEIADARTHRAYTFCDQLVGHVNMTEFAKKITEKITAVAHRAEAVAYANEQKQRAETAEAELVALRKEQDEYEENVVGDLNEANIGLARKAARAEAAVARVHAALATFDGRGVIAAGAVNLDIPTAGEVLNAVRTALGQPQDGTHVYLSTGCLHDDHNYCKNPTGLAGAKRPAECKKCGAGCICPCHTQPEEPPCTSALPPQPSPKPSPTDATPTA